MYIEEQSRAGRLRTLRSLPIIVARGILWVQQRCLKQAYTPTSSSIYYPLPSPLCWARNESRSDRLVANNLNRILQPSHRSYCRPTFFSSTTYNLKFNNVHTKLRGTSNGAFCTYTTQLSRQKRGCEWSNTVEPECGWGQGCWAEDWDRQPSDVEGVATGELTISERKLGDGETGHDFC